MRHWLVDHNRSWHRYGSEVHNSTSTDNSPSKWHKAPGFGQQGSEALCTSLKNRNHITNGCSNSLCRGTSRDPPRTAAYDSLSSATSRPLSHRLTINSPSPPTRCRHPPSLDIISWSPNTWPDCFTEPWTEYGMSPISPQNHNAVSVCAYLCGLRSHIFSRLFCPCFKSVALSSTHPIDLCSQSYSTFFHFGDIRARSVEITAHQQPNHLLSIMRSTTHVKDSSLSSCEISRGPNLLRMARTDPKLPCPYTSY